VGQWTPTVTQVAVRRSTREARPAPAPRSTIWTVRPVRRPGRCRAAPLMRRIPDGRELVQGASLRQRSEGRSLIWGDQDMDNNWAPITAALIAATVAIVGYLVTHAQIRRDRKAREFADALAAVCDYVQLPYSIYLRRLAIPKLGPGDALAEALAEAHSEVNKRMNEVWSHMHFSQIWLQVESQDVGQKYEELVTEARKEGPASRQRAWEDDLHDIESWAAARRDFGVSRSMACRWRACILEMRVALQPTWRFRYRRKVREKARNETFIPPFAPVTLPAVTDEDCQGLPASKPDPTGS
jgi:hypothetical protein